MAVSTTGGNNKRYNNYANDHDHLKTRPEAFQVSDWYFSQAQEVLRRAPVPTLRRDT